MEIRGAGFNLDKMGAEMAVRRCALGWALPILAFFIAPPALAKEEIDLSDPAKRQQQIVGHPPRIAPLKPEQLGDEAKAIVTRIRQAAGAPSTGDVPEYVATFLKHPSLYEKHVALGTELLGNASLRIRDRELAVLRTGWLLGAPYEWGEHVAIGKRAGLTSAEIERIVEGSRAAGWSPQDRAILQAAEELREEAMISGSTWAELAAFLDEKQLIELVYVIGNYTKVAYFQNALRLRLQKDNTGLQAR